MILEAALADRIISHCRSGLPNEACGLLAGSPGRIEAVYCIPNIEASPVSYTIEPEGHFRALTDAESRGWELLGAFHSHVDGPAIPSATDIAGAAEPEWIWLVVGPMTGQPQVRGFRIRGGTAVEEELEIGPR